MTAKKMNAKKMNARRYIAPVLIGVIGAAILIELGLWQVRRMHWKETVLADIRAHIAAPSVPFPMDPQQQKDEFLSVAITGTIGAKNLQVLASVERRDPVYRIISPMYLDDGRCVLLDRGIVRLTDKNAPRPAVHASVLGNVHWPDETNAYTPPPDQKLKIWFGRDLTAMARVLDCAPVMVVERSSDEKNPVATPYPVDTVGIPNNHLQYVVTWFGLAIVWLGMSAYWVWRIARKKD